MVEGLTATLEAIMGGAVSYGYRCAVSAPAEHYDRAIIDWQRSDDGGASWRDVAHSYQNEANPLPFGTGHPWRPWSVSHGFIATAADQGALIRVHALLHAAGDRSRGATLRHSVPTLASMFCSRARCRRSSPRRAPCSFAPGQTANLSATVSGAARTHAAMAVSRRQFEWRLDRCHHRHRRHHR